MQFLVASFLFAFEASILWQVLCSQKKANVKSYCRSKERLFWLRLMQLQRLISSRLQKLDFSCIWFPRKSGPKFWQKLSSKVTRSTAFSNKSRALCVASVGNILQLIFNSCKEIRPNSSLLFIFWVACPSHLSNFLVFETKR